jgi:RimJ/RimL family protein N-acetyltransferase
MINDKNCSFRIAAKQDIDFIVLTILEAEKSGSDRIGLANVFNLSETELQDCLVKILDEEEEGCEFSLDSFIVAAVDNKPVAAFAGWIEGENEYNQPSAILKSNLISFHFPKDKIKESSKISFVKEIQIEREFSTFQLEYAFVAEEHRGKGLINAIIEELLKRAKLKNPNLKKSQVQVFGNNHGAIKVYERSGYTIRNIVKSKNLEILNYFPYNEKILMEKEL